MASIKDRVAEVEAKAIFLLLGLFLKDASPYEQLVVLVPKYVVFPATGHSLNNVRLYKFGQHAYFLWREVKFKSGLIDESLLVLY